MLSKGLNKIADEGIANESTFDYIPDTKFESLKFDFFTPGRDGAGHVSFLALLEDPAAHIVNLTLKNILRASHCNENWEFLEELYNLNKKHKELSQKIANNEISIADIVAERKELETKLYDFCLPYFGEAKPDTVQPFFPPLSETAADKTKQFPPKYARSFTFSRNLTFQKGLYKTANSTAALVELTTNHVAVKTPMATKALESPVPELAEELNTRSFTFQAELVMSGELLSLNVPEASTELSDTSVLSKKLKLKIPQSLTPIVTPQTTPRSQRGKGPNVPVIDLDHKGLNIHPDKIYFINDLRLANKLKITDFISTQNNSKIIDDVFFQLLLPNLDRANVALQKSIVIYIIANYIKMQPQQFKTNACFSLFATNQREYRKLISRSKYLLQRFTMHLNRVLNTRELENERTELADIKDKLTPLEKKLACKNHFSIKIEEILKITSEYLQSANQQKVAVPRFKSK